jgi:hypothetical protein
MNPIDKIPTRVLAAFLDRCGSLADKIRLFANSSEEIHESLNGRKSVKLYQRGDRSLSLAQAMGARARLEENYLFDTRNFAAAAVPAGEHIFFQNNQGGNAANNGFPAGVVNMSDVETNMDTPGQIAQGKNYVFNQIGVSFNSDIAFGDLVNMIEDGALRFEKQGGQYTLKHGPVKMWPGGTGITGFQIDGAAAANLSANSNGQADMRAARRLSIPRIIKEKESFAYKYVVPRIVRNTDGTTATTLTERVIMTVWLWGGQQDNIPV